MCCIVHRQKGAKAIAPDNIKKIVKKNPHGWGICYKNDDGEFYIRKSMNMDEAMEEIRKAEADDREFIFHARWATHGEKNEENCHPFPLTGGVMFHNGKMDVGCWRKEMSDSWHFASKVSKLFGKKKRSMNFIVNKYKNIIKESRLAFMLEDGTVLRYGPICTETYTQANKWFKLDDVWYSKDDWKFTSLTTTVYPPINPVGGYNFNRNNSLKAKDARSGIDSCGGGCGGWNSMWMGSEEDFEENERYSVGEDDVRYLTPVSEKDNDINEYNRVAAEIEECIRKGMVTESHIERLTVDDLGLMNEAYPATMALYLQRMIKEYTEHGLDR